MNDEVSVGDGMFSQVYMFTHRISSGHFGFVQHRTIYGQVLRLTGGHYLYTSNGRLVRVSSIRRGDELLDADGARKVVTSVFKVVDVGLYSPQTMHGKIVVNGVITSTYTDAIERRRAQAILAPLRLAKALQGLTVRIIEDNEWSTVRHARSHLKT